MIHGGLSRGSNRKIEPFFISDILSLLKVKVMVPLGSMVDLHKLPSAARHPADPALQRHVPLSTTTFSHTCHHYHVSYFHLFPSHMLWPILHLSHHSISYLLVIVTLETARCYTVYFFAPTTLQASIHCNESLVHSFWLLTHHKCSDILLLPRAGVILWLGRTSRAGALKTPGCHTPPHPETPPARPLCL